MMAPVTSWKNGKLPQFVDLTQDSDDEMDDDDEEDPADKVSYTQHNTIGRPISARYPFVILLKFISFCCCEFYGFFDVIFVFLTVVVFGWWHARLVGLLLAVCPCHWAPSSAVEMA